jgi:hypothetical protein
MSRVNAMNEDYNLEIKYSPRADAIFLSVFLAIILVSVTVFLTVRNSWKAALFGMLFGVGALFWRASQKVSVKDGTLTSRLLFIKRKVKLSDIENAKLGDRNTYIEQKFMSDVRIDIYPKPSTKQEKFSINLYPFCPSDVNKLLSILKIH